MPKKPKPLPLRCFVGVKFPLLKQIQPLLDDLSISAKDKSLKIRVTPAANLHLTLKFLGTVAEEQGPSLQAILSQVGHQLEPFQLSCSGVGFFKNSMWIGIEESLALRDLVLEINQSLESLGFEIEAKPYSPHITIARFAADAKSVLKTLEAKYSEHQWGQMDVSKFHLYKSHTLAEGAKYFILSKYELGLPD